MAVINRTLDQSQQRFTMNAQAGAVATGVTGILGIVPTPCVLEAGQIAAFGLSGAPSYQLTVQRFIVGTGITAITIGGANVPPAFGTSGLAVSGVSLNAAGSTLNNLLPGDVIMYLSGVANTAVTGLAVSLVMRPIQDIKKWFGGLV